MAYRTRQFIWFFVEGAQPLAQTRCAERRTSEYLILAFPFYKFPSMLGLTKFAAMNGLMLPVHAKAMPVVLTKPDEIDQLLAARSEEALKLKTACGWLPADCGKGIEEGLRPEAEWFLFG